MNGAIRRAEDVAKAPISEYSRSFFNRVSVTQVDEVRDNRR